MLHVNDTSENCQTKSIPLYCSLCGLSVHSTKCTQYSYFVVLYRLGNFTGPGATELRQSVYYPSSSKSTLKNMNKYLLQSNTVGIFEASRYRCIASSVSLLGSLQGYGRQGESWYSYSDNWFPLVVLSQHPILSDQTERQLPSVEIIYYLVPCEWRLETDKIQPDHSLKETCLNLKSNIGVVVLVISFKLCIGILWALGLSSSLSYVALTMMKLNLLGPPLLT